jgi:crossover junction endodeoxyribonuclease RuvC
MKYYIGVDPGLSGGLAFVSEGYIHAAEPMPTNTITRNGKTKKELDYNRLAAILKSFYEYPEWGDIVSTVVEQVGAMPGQGVSSMFAFGKATGAVYGSLGHFNGSVFSVAPRTWKKYLCLPVGATKNDSRELASNIFPKDYRIFKLKKNDGIAEAVLIAYYYSKIDTCENLSKVISTKPLRVSLSTKSIVTKPGKAVKG